MVVQEKIAGTTLNELLCDGTAGEPHLEAAARSIAVLHRGKIPLDRTYSLADEMELIESCGPAALLNRIRKVAAPLRPSTSVPVHRDFYDKQLLVDGPRIALIDLDTLAMGDAEIDLANFAAHLHLRAVQNRVAWPAARWEHAFLTEYARRAARPPDAALLSFYFATACVRLACKYQPEPGGARVAAELLSLAEEKLRDL
jgi:aminoglycoside phosphotransferase (APT) family kinase protein